MAGKGETTASQVCLFDTVCVCFSLTMKYYKAVKNEVDLEFLLWLRGNKPNCFFKDAGSIPGPTSVG